MICGECLQEIHPYSTIDHMGLSVRHRFRQDCLFAVNQKYLEEHVTRIKYQGLVYVICAELDHILNRHVSKGTGTIANEESIISAIREINKK